MFSGFPAARSGPVYSSGAIEPLRTQAVGTAADPNSSRIGRHLLSDEDKNHLGGIAWGGAAGVCICLMAQAGQPEIALFAIGATIALYKAAVTLHRARLWRDEAMALVRRHRRTIRKLQNSCFSWQEAATAHIDFHQLGAGEAARGMGSRHPLAATGENIVTGPWEGAR